MFKNSRSKTPDQKFTPKNSRAKTPSIILLFMLSLLTAVCAGGITVVVMLMAGVSSFYWLMITPAFVFYLVKSIVLNWIAAEVVWRNR